MRVPRHPFPRFPSKPVHVAVPIRTNHILKAISIKVGQLEEHNLLSFRTDLVLLPATSFHCNSCTRVLKPFHPGVRSLPVRHNHIHIPIFVEIMSQDGHDPSGIIDPVKLPVTKDTRIFRRLQPPHRSIGPLGPYYKIRAIHPVYIEGAREHPSLLFTRYRERGCVPALLLEILILRMRSPVHKHAPVGSLATTHHVHRTVPVEVYEYGIFRRSYLPDRH